MEPRYSSGGYGFEDSSSDEEMYDYDKMNFKRAWYDKSVTRLPESAEEGYKPIGFDSITATHVTRLVGTVTVPSLFAQIRADRNVVKAIIYSHGSYNAESYENAVLVFTHNTPVKTYGMRRAGNLEKIKFGNNEFFIVN